MQLLAMDPSPHHVTWAAISTATASTISHGVCLRHVLILTFPGVREGLLSAVCAPPFFLLAGLPSYKGLSLNAWEPMLCTVCCDGAAVVQSSNYM